jgi:hypothetical protein
MYVQGQIPSMWYLSVTVVGAPLRGALSVFSWPFVVAFIHMKTISYEEARH